MGKGAVSIDVYIESGKLCHFCWLGFTSAVTFISYLSSWVLSYLLSLLSVRNCSHAAYIHTFLGKVARNRGLCRYLRCSDRSGMLSFACPLGG